MNRKVSLKDIAKAAGVSVALVSYVLNNKKEGRISKPVAEKIRAIALSMNYRTNQIARSLKTSKTYTIGLILADISNPFSAALARYIEDEADRHGYTVIIGSSDEQPGKFRKILDALANRQADGLILSPPGEAAPQITTLLQQQVPFVLIDRYFPGIATNSIVLDNFIAAFEATSHLLDRGYRNIGLINYASSLFHLADRTRGYQAAMAAGNISYPGNAVQEVQQASLQEDTEKAVALLLSSAKPSDALLFGSNVIAMHAVKYLNRQRFRIPEDLALVCFDETDAFDLFYAPLTCIRQPIKAMAEKSVALLLQNIEDSNGPVRNIRFNGELIVRASSAQKIYTG